jgi:hypothetical protein
MRCTVSIIAWLMFISIICPCISIIFDNLAPKSFFSSFCSTVFWCCSGCLNCLSTGPSDLRNLYRYRRVLNRCLTSLDLPCPCLAAKFIDHIMIGAFDVAKVVLIQATLLGALPSIHERGVVFTHAYIRLLLRLRLDMAPTDLIVSRIYPIPKHQRISTPSLSLFRLHNQAVSTPRLCLSCLAFISTKLMR